MKWQSIETAPKDGTTILGIDYPRSPEGIPLDRGAPVEWVPSLGRWQSCSNGVVMSLTHWAPMPTGPAGGES